MPSPAFDDFIDDCFINDDHICRSEIYRTRKYEKRVNFVASELIAGIQAAEKNFNNVAISTD
tara:strand:+ start:403 stop:588 length:186 start_codon:yes stop_codon:yes gene_type:complete